MALDAGAIPEALPGGIARVDFNTMRGIINGSFPIQTIDIDNLQVTAAKVAADAVETDKILNLNVTKAKAELGFGRYVVRSTGAWDWDETDLSVKGAWQVNGIDAGPTGKAIVPAGAIAVAFMMRAVADTAGASTAIRKNAAAFGNSLVIQVANQITSYFFFIIGCDADIKFDYFVSNGGVAWAGIDLAVRGWFI